MPLAIARQRLLTATFPFEGGEHGRIAVKVIDDRGNELLVVRSLNGAKE
jgi:adenine-specific DNA-methyltransferase